MTVSKGSRTANATKVTFTATPDSKATVMSRDERVSLAPLTPEAALQALLSTPPTSQG